MFIYSGFGNVIALQIILRNEILGSNNVFKVTSTLNKVWLIFVLKGIPIGKSSISKINVACSNTERFSLYYESLHTRNQDIFKIHCIFREPWNIQKTDGKNIPLKHIVLRFGNSSKQFSFCESYLGRFRLIQDPGVTNSNNVKPTPAIQVRFLF